MMCDRFAPGRSVIAPSRTAATSSNLLSLPKPLRGADPSLALPDAGMSQPHSSSRAVPSTCPKQRSATVIHGQQRSVAGAGELRHPRMLACRTVLPKLAVLRVEDRSCRARPADPVPLAAEDPSARGPRQMDRNLPLSWGLHQPICSYEVRFPISEAKGRLKEPQRSRPGVWVDARHWGRVGLRWQSASAASGDLE